MDWAALGLGLGIGGLVAFFVGFWVGRADRDEVRS